MQEDSLPSEPTGKPKNTGVEPIPFPGELPNPRIARRAVCGTRGSLRTMHGGGSAPSCCAFTHRVAFEEVRESGGLLSSYRRAKETSSRLVFSRCFGYLSFYPCAKLSDDSVFHS